MRRIFILLIGFIVSYSLSAQVPGYQGRPQGNRADANMNAGRIFGKVLDGATGKPMEAASVQLTQSKMDTTTHQMKDITIAAALTNKKGEFSIDKLSLFGKKQIIISAVGYQPVISDVQFDFKPGGGDMSQMMNATDKDLGNFKLDPVAQKLEGVVVTAQKPMLQMGIDRKIFNVDKNITSVGGTAVDVMRNVPSLNVDVDGNVTLRNQSPQIFVDGRPTTLTLDQIPADQIESVEIITNPSAKFDASGGGAGILNIVLKKDRKPGYNGNLRSDFDSKGSYGLGGDANIRQGKINFFASGRYNKRKGTSSQVTQRNDFMNGLNANLDQSGTSKNDGHFAFGRAGFDFLADNRNTFTLSGMMVNGKFDNTGLLDLIRDTTYPVGLVTHQLGIINTNSGFSFKNTGGTLSYQHNFAKPKHNITADINYNSSRNSSNSLSLSQYFDGQNNPVSEQAKQLIQNSGRTKYLIAQSDYTNPISDKIKIEAGLRAAVRNYNSENENFLFDNTVSKYQPVPALNSKYKFNDQVYAGYVTYSQKINDFSFQLGGRIESSFYKGSLVDSNRTFSNKFPFSFFPSVFLTQKINDKQDIQLNYSRKINRPNFFQLIPYYDFTDSLNISRGNPNLQPEFTNLLELSYQYNLGKGNNFLATLYYRNTNDLITRYQFWSPNPNPARSDSIFVSSFENASHSNAYGMEFTLMNRIFSWWNLSTNVNVYNSAINGTNLESALNNNQWSWFGKINSTFTLPAAISVQLSGDYTSKTILPPARGGSTGGMWGAPLSTANGYSEPIYGFDLAIKKDFLKDRSLSASVSMSDIFATRKYKTYSSFQSGKDISSTQFNERFRNPQVLRVSLNWRFGKFDTSLFKRKNMKADQSEMQNGMQGMQQ